MDAWVANDQSVVDLCRAILLVFRDHGPRENRQKSRLMWLIDQWGIERFRQEVVAQLGVPLEKAAEKDAMDWHKRDHLGIYPQKQAGLSYIGLNVPVGRLQAQDMLDLARIAELYGAGELRLTVEQNVIIPHISFENLELVKAEPLLNKFSPNPSPLTRSLVSCTGSQFCGLAIVETKNRALAISRELEQRLSLPNPVRIHWTGCPNSCGQPQVADIGLMGTKVSKNGKIVEGVDIFVGGKVGKDAKLGSCIQKGVACEDLIPVLSAILQDNFGAVVKS